MDDVLIYTSGDGTDFRQQGNNIEVGASLYMQVLLALFGGNPNHVTKQQYSDGELRGDYWANHLMPIPEQFNSYTETTLRNVVLNSAGIARIESAVKRDLEYLSEAAGIDVSVNYPTSNKVSINVTLTEPDQKEKQSLNVIWDSARGEIISNNTI